MVNHAKQEGKRHLRCACRGPHGVCEVDVPLLTARSTGDTLGMEAHMTRKEQIEEKIKQLKAQARALDARAAKQERAERTRRLVRLGAMLESDKDQGALVKKYLAAMADEDKAREFARAKKGKPVS